MTKIVWANCTKCNKPSPDGDHACCDEPTWQRCTGCGQPVHLNHVEYTGDDFTPWCASCNPERFQP